MAAVRPVLRLTAVQVSAYMTEEPAIREPGEIKLQLDMDATDSDSESDSEVPDKLRFTNAEMRKIATFAQRHSRTLRGVQYRGYDEKVAPARPFVRPVPRPVVPVAPPVVQSVALPSASPSSLPDLEPSTQAMDSLPDMSEAVANALAATAPRGTVPVARPSSSRQHVASVPNVPVCPVHKGPVVNPLQLQPCGHVLCINCFTTETCPVCRMPHRWGR